MRKPFFLLVFILTGNISLLFAKKPLVPHSPTPSTPQKQNPYKKSENNPMIKPTPKTPMPNPSNPNKAQ